jgi:hypothetical protein
MRFFRNIGRFVYELVIVATVGGGSAAKIAKGLAGLLLLLLAILGALARREPSKDVGWLHVFFSPDGDYEKMSPSWFEFTISDAILVFILGVWIAVACGITWVRFKRFEIGDTIEVDSVNRYRLLTTSLGWDEEEVAIRLEKVADATGELPADDLPCELGRLRLVCGLCQKITIFQAVLGARQTETFLFLPGTAPSPSPKFGPLPHHAGEYDGIFPLFVSDERKEKQWILISIGRYEKRWFSIRPGSVPGSIPILHEDPPFLKWKWQGPSLYHRLQQAWNGFWTTPP